MMSGFYTKMQGQDIQMNKCDLPHKHNEKQRPYNLNRCTRRIMPQIFFLKGHSKPKANIILNRKV